MRGPGDTQKDSFGIKVGDAQAPASPTTVRNCAVTGFWWGIHVESSDNVLIESNHLYENGWKSPTENGTGYGLDVANSTGVTVRDNLIADNGNEGMHLSSSTGVTVEDNVFQDNGMEQLYLIHADSNVIRRNRAMGGSQGLEMRFSSNNDFSYNVWAGSPLHWLENDNNDNTFFYEHFEGRVAVGTASTGNVFRLSEFSNPTGNCLTIAAADVTLVYKSYFRSCNWDVLATSGPVTLDRSVNTLAKVSKTVKVQFPGCTGDFDLDGSVGESDRPTILQAMGSVLGAAGWNPEADLDHDGDVDGADLAIFDGQLGPCAADLTVSVVNNPPTVAVIGGTFSVTDTVRNDSSRFASGTSRTQYYLSVDGAKNTGDKLLGGRSVPALLPNATSAGTVTVAVPSSTLPGDYFLLACADDTALVPEGDETDNCLASTTTVNVGRPDLAMTSLGDPQTAVTLGTSFSVTDTVKNDSLFPAGASRVQYYLSLDSIKSAADRLLTGSRTVASLAAGGTSAGTIAVTAPASTPVAAYYLLACADDGKVVTESDETNNCRPSTGQIQVGRPDLVVAALNEPQATVVRGSGLPVADTVLNQSPFSAGGSRVQYYLSLDGLKNSGDRLLTGTRTVAILAPAGTSAGTVTVTVPSSMALGPYFLLACADDGFAVIESNETNNCRASLGRVTVTATP